MQLFSKSIKKEKNSRSQKSKSEKYAFIETTPETLVLVPDFVVACNEKTLKDQHSTFNFIDKKLIRNESDRTIDLTDNLKFSYKAARNSYFVSNFLL